MTKKRLETAASRTRRRALLFLVPGLLAMACAQTQAPEPGATTETSSQEIPGTHDANDLNPWTAQQWIDRVRLGRGVDQNGAVPEAMRTESFATGDEINLSMEVADAPAGTRVRIEILREDSREAVWTATKTIEAGRSHLSFQLSANDLEPGSYEASVIVGDESVARNRFAVG